MAAKWRKFFEVLDHFQAWLYITQFRPLCWVRELVTRLFSKKSDTWLDFVFLTAVKLIFELENVSLTWRGIGTMRFFATWKSFSWIYLSTYLTGVLIAWSFCSKYRTLVTWRDSFHLDWIFFLGHNPCFAILAFLSTRVEPRNNFEWK